MEIKSVIKDKLFLDCFVLFDALQMGSVFDIGLQSFVKAFLLCHSFLSMSALFLVYLGVF